MSHADGLVVGRMETLTMNTQYKRLPEKSEHWKDLRAGWHYWKINFTCQECQQPATDKIHGTEEGIKTYLANPINLVCQKCMETL